MALCLVKARQMPPHFMGMSLACKEGAEASEGPAQATLQPPVGSPALLLSPLGSITSGSSGREVMKSAGSGRISSSRPAVGREKRILVHASFACVCLGAGLQRELAQLRMGPAAEGKVSRAGRTLDVSLLGNSVLERKALTEACPGSCERDVLNNRADTRPGLSLTCP